jgi:hypothetical protein
VTSLNFISVTLIFSLIVFILIKALDKKSNLSELAYSLCFPLSISLIFKTIFLFLKENEPDALIRSIDNLTNDYKSYLLVGANILEIVLPFIFIFFMIFFFKKSC